MGYQNAWDRAQRLAETAEEYIAAGIGWCLEDTGELPDMENNLLVAYGPNGCDEMFIEKFGPQTREQLEAILVGIMWNSIANIN